MPGFLVSGRTQPSIWKTEANAAIAKMAPEVGEGFREGATGAMTRRQWSAVGEMVSPGAGRGFGKSYGTGFVNGAAGAPTINVNNDHSTHFSNNANSTFTNIANRGGETGGPATTSGDQNQLRAKDDGARLAAVRKKLESALVDCG